MQEKTVLTELFTE